MTAVIENDYVITFTTWDRSTVPDKPPHVGI